MASERLKILAAEKGAPAKGEAVATFTEGWFWHSGIVFQSLAGVRDAVSGYAAGRSPNPDYENVCTGEAVTAMILQPLPLLVLPTESPFFGNGKATVNETLVQVDAASFLQVSGQGFHYPVHHAGFYPLLKAAMNALIRRILRRKVLPGCTYLQNPQDAFQHFTLVSPGPTFAIGAATALRDQIPDLLPLFVRQFHATKLPNPFMRQLVNIYDSSMQRVHSQSQKEKTAPEQLAKQDVKKENRKQVADERENVLDKTKAQPQERTINQLKPLNRSGVGTIFLNSLLR